MLPNQKLLENIFTQSFNAIAITNTDFDNLKFEFVNDAFLELTGYPREEIIGESPKILQGKNTKKDETSRLKKLCLKGETFKGNNINYKKNGTEYSVEWMISPIKNDEGDIINYLSIQKDLSHEKELEKKLIDNVKLNTLHSISAGLTHELNTALTTIKGSTEIVQLDANLIKDKELNERLSTEIIAINKGITDITNIANSLHHLTNSEVKLEYRVNVFDLLMEAIKLFEEKIKKYTTLTINGHNIFDKKDMYYKEIYADISKESIKHVFIIILDNALDEFKSSKNKNQNLINIDIKQFSTEMYVDFIDNAGGMKSTNIAKIFDPLYHKKKHGGLGIGLHVAKNIILDNKGDIEVYSTPPQTTVRIKIPL